MPENNKRFELKVYTDYTVMEGLSTPAAYLQKGCLTGLSGMALTDRLTVSGLPDWIHDPDTFRCIRGVELVVHNDVFPYQFHERFCVSVLIRDAAGLRRVYRILSRLAKTGEENGYSFQKLLEHREHLLLGSCCEEGIFFHHAGGERDEEDFLEAAELFDYLEICPSMDKSMAEQISRLGDELNIPVAAVSDARYCYKAQGEHYRLVLSANQLKSVPAEDKHLYTAEQLTEHFAFLGEQHCREAVYDNTAEIAARIRDFDLLPFEILPLSPQTDSCSDVLKEKLHAQYGADLPEFVRERLQEELNFFHRENLFGHLDTLYAMLRGVQDSYLCCGYGASFIAFLLGISPVNPLPRHIRCPKCGTVSLCSPGAWEEACPVCGESCPADGLDLPFLYFSHSTEQNQLRISGSRQALRQAEKQLRSVFSEDQVMQTGVFRSMPFSRFRGFYKQLAADHEGELPELPQEESFDKITRLGGGVSIFPNESPAFLLAPQDQKISDYTAVCTEVTGKKQTFVTGYHAEDLESCGLTVVGMRPDTILEHLSRLRKNSKAVLPGRSSYIPEVVCYLRDMSPLEIRFLPEEYIGYLIRLSEYFPMDSFENLVDIFSIGHCSRVWVGNFDGLVEEGIVSPDEVFTNCDDLFSLLIRAGMESEDAGLLVSTAHAGMAGDVLTPDMLQKMKRLNLPDWLPGVLSAIRRLHAKAYAAAEADAFCRLLWYRLHDMESYRKICLKE